MLRFLAVVLLSFHLICGEHLIVNQELEEVKSRRFTFEDGEYEISAMRTDWYTARNFCKVQGGQLLSIETREENTAVLQALGDFLSESFWTSGCDIYKEGHFYWDATGAPFENFTFWGIGKPVANNTEHCVRLNATMNHMWSDANCDLAQFFVCEFHPCSDKLKSESIVAKEGKTPLLRFTFENGTYEVSDEGLAWVDAKNACKLKGMELVSIETFEEHLAIMDEMLSLPDNWYWTSGTNLGHLGNYYWEGTGRAIGPYTGWGPGQPDDPDIFQFILLPHGYNYMWNDIPPMGKNNYICELQPCKSPNFEQ